MTTLQHWRTIAGLAIIFADHEGDAHMPRGRPRFRIFSTRNQHDKDDESAPYLPLSPGQLYLSDEHTNVSFGAVD